MKYIAIISILVLASCSIPSGDTPSPSKEVSNTGQSSENAPKEETPVVGSAQQDAPSKEELEIMKNENPVIRLEDKSEEEIEELLEADYIGLTEEKALIKATLSGVSFRFTVIDGELQDIEKDSVPGRINAIAEDGIVVKYQIEGE